MCLYRSGWGAVATAQPSPLDATGFFYMWIVTVQMIGCIKAISPCVKSASAELFLGLHTVLAPSGEERTLGAAAQVERAGRCYRRSDSDTHAWCGHATVMVLVSSASGPRVSGCPRACRY